MEALGTDRDNRVYTVTVEVESDTPRAALRVAPVYGNRDIAFSARWDDSNKHHGKMHALMAKHGMKGTFFVNGAKPIDFKRLTHAGMSLGSHSMTHERLAANPNFNRMFWEVAACRAVVEAASDQSLNGYCFSDGNYRNMSRPVVQPSIALMLERCGYHLNVSQKFLAGLGEERDPVSSIRICPAGDRNPSMAKFETHLQELLADPSWKESDPNISMGVHVWINSQKGWDALGEIFAKYAHNPDWWYTSQTDYAGYRKMVKRHALAQTAVSGTTATYTLTLPYAADIGSDTPLTLVFEGEAKAVRIDGRPVAVRGDGQVSLVDVAPPPHTLNPTRIGYIENAENAGRSPVIKGGDASSSGETALRPWLRVADNPGQAGATCHTLLLNLQAGAQAISRIRVGYLLPLMYEHCAAEDAPDLAPGESTNLTRQLALNPDPEFTWGMPYLLCKVDYLVGGRPERVYASVFGTPVPPPESGGFRDQSLVSSLFRYDDQMKEKLTAMSRPDAAVLAELQWYGPTEQERLTYNDAVVSIPERLARENLREIAAAKPPCHYVISSNVQNPKGATHMDTRLFRRCAAIFVNGEEVTGSAKAKIPIKPGSNRILFLYPVVQTTYKKITAFNHKFLYRRARP